jgi:large subunit ribosomal protein L18
MTTKSTYRAAFRRRQEGKTNYSRRLALVKSGLPRLCIRKSNRYITAQLIEFNAKGDNVLAQASSKQLEGLGWKAGKNLPSAYLTGMLLASNAKKANVGEAILDIGFNTPVHGSRAFAALKGALDNGLKVRFGESVESILRILQKAWILDSCRKGFQITPRRALMLRNLQNFSAR